MDAQFAIRQQKLVGTYGVNKLNWYSLEFSLAYWIFFIFTILLLMQICVKEDEFLERASSTVGSDSFSSSITYRKDVAFKEYLKYLDQNKVFDFLFVSHDAHKNSVVHY